MHLGWVDQPVAWHGRGSRSMTARPPLQQQSAPQGSSSALPMSTQARKKVDMPRRGEAGVAQGVSWMPMQSGRALLKAEGKALPVQRQRWHAIFQGLAMRSMAAAKLFVDKYVKSGCVLGVGSGELVNLAIAEVGKRLASGNLKSVTAVASCNAAASTAAFHGVPQTMLDESTQIHVGFEQVDMLDVSANAAIFGVEQDPQQPQILMSRYIMSRAEKLVVLVDCQDVRRADLDLTRTALHGLRCMMMS
eukprot:213604-Chlamydomonas_euryale.AAC.5